MTHCEVVKSTTDIECITEDPDNVEDEVFSVPETAHTRVITQARTDLNGPPFITENARVL